MQCGLSVVAALIKLEILAPAASRNWAHQPTFKEKKLKTIVYTKRIQFYDSFENSLVSSVAE